MQNSHSPHEVSIQETPQNIEKCRDLLEKIQQTLDPKTRKMHRTYLVGYIDCLYDQKIITAHMRNEIYMDYL